MQLELTEQLLKYVDENGQVDTLALVPIFGVDHQKIVGALKSIESNSELLLNVEQASHKSWELTGEGKSVLQNGSHEACVFNSVPAEGIAQADLMKVNVIRIPTSFAGIASYKRRIQRWFKCKTFNGKSIVIFLICRHHQMPKWVSAKPWLKAGLWSISPVTNH